MIRHVDNIPNPSDNLNDTQELAKLNDELLECIHCGLCLESCPTYVELIREEDSPRGRIYMMRSVAEGRAGIDPSVMKHLDMCLGCRACETACPSDVKYGFLLEHTRSHIENSGHRPTLPRFGRRILLEVFTNPRLMAVAMFMATLPSRIFRMKPMAPGSIVSKVIGAESRGGPLYLAEFPKPTPQRLPASFPAAGEKRLRIALLEGCVMPVLFPEVNRATISVLAKLGCEIVVPRDQGCCGALHVHNGYSDAARRMALRNMEAFEKAGVDVIVVNSAGCGSTMKEYPGLFEQGSPEHQRAEAFSSRVKDVSEVICDLLPHARFNPLDLTVTYHDACHLAHGQKIRKQPRDMLSAIPGLTMKPLMESDHCCGSAGVYSFTQPELAARLQKKKIENIEATGAAVVATGNPGCQMWIRSGLIAQNSGVSALHPIEIMDAALKHPDNP